jgi:hypothetical protein
MKPSLRFWLIGGATLPYCAAANVTLAQPMPPTASARLRRLHLDENAANSRTSAAVNAFAAQPEMTDRARKS